VFYGLGADGTVGANKNSIKIIGEETDLLPRVLRSTTRRRAARVTVSHLRFGRGRSARVPDQPGHFVGCHQFSFLEQIDVLEQRRDGASSCSTAPYARDRSGTTSARVQSRSSTSICGST
jgi:pyruvate-ferredoxin/flavodoxin oxidoreductase